MKEENLMMEAKKYKAKKNSSEEKTPGRKTT